LVVILIEIPWVKDNFFLNDWNVNKTKIKPSSTEIFIFSQKVLSFLKILNLSYPTPSSYFQPWNLGRYHVILTVALWSYCWWNFQSNLLPLIQKLCYFGNSYLDPSIDGLRNKIKLSQIFKCWYFYFIYIRKPDFNV
jgi:hypothetical protein